ncbi:MAG: aconitate hydratase AcnA [Arcobacter sp.]|nr:aconitate hydratase AcnA [Arcobacter sp.]
MDILNSFEIENETFYYYDISKVINSSKKLTKLPIVLKILLEENLRKAKDSIEFHKIVNIFINRMNSEIFFYPSRIIMKDFTGIPALVDLASMRDSVKESGGDVKKINPQILTDLVIDHSLEVYNSTNNSLQININNDCEFNRERYEFAKWAENNFTNLRIVPPGSGVYHQVNLEYLSTILHIEEKDGKFLLYPETIVGTDFNTKMINSFGVLTFGVHDIDAQSILLGLPISLTLPKVVGVNIEGKLKDGVTSSDLLDSLKNSFKEHSLEGKIIEFYGDGLEYLSLEDRTLIANMAPIFKAKCLFFAIDNKTISYFNKTRETNDYSKLLKTFLEKQKLFYNGEELDYDEIINFKLSLLEPKICLTKRINDHISIDNLKNVALINQGKYLKDADIVFASITSCISTSNPYLLIHAALIAKKAYDFGLSVNKNIKKSFYPNSFIVKEYLENMGLLKYLEYIGFNIMGYGCNSYLKDYISLDNNIEQDLKEYNLNVCSVISGQNNIEGKINPLIKSSYLMSPSLVIIYSLIGTVKFDLFNDSIANIVGKDICLKDIWPSNKEVGYYLKKLDNTLYKDIYKNIFKGNEFWRKLIVDKSDTYKWNSNSTFIQSSKLFDYVFLEKIDIKKAEILIILGDDIRTDHISPSGQIPLYSEAAKYLENKGVKSYDYNTFETRRANSEVMLRGIFDNQKLKNYMLSKEGGYTIDYDTEEIISIYEKAKRLKERNKDIVIIAGEQYAKGTPIDWASKGTKLLGVKAVIAKSFDENYKSNLIYFGVLPLEFLDEDIKSLTLKGNENITIKVNDIKANSIIKGILHRNDVDIELELKCRLDNSNEVEYYKNGGVLPFLLNNIK